MNLKFDSGEGPCVISSFDALPGMPASGMSRLPHPDEDARVQLPPTEERYQNNSLRAEHADTAAASHSTSGPPSVSDSEYLLLLTGKPLASSPTSPKAASQSGSEHSAADYHNTSPALIPWSDCSAEPIPIEHEHAEYSPTSPQLPSHIERVRSEIPSYAYFPISPDYRFANGIGPSSADQVSSSDDGFAAGHGPEDEEHIMTLGAAWEEYRANEANEEEELIVSCEEVMEIHVRTTRWAEETSKHILPILEDAYEAAHCYVEHIYDLKRRTRAITPDFFRDSSPAKEDWTDTTFYHIFDSAVDLIEANLQPRFLQFQQHQPTDLPDAGVVSRTHGSSHQMAPSITHAQHRLSGAKVTRSRFDSEFKERATTADGQRRLNPRSRFNVTDSSLTTSRMNAYMLANYAIRNPKSPSRAAPSQKIPSSLTRSPFASLTPSYGKRRRSDSSSVSNYRSPPIFSTPDGNARKKVKTGYAQADAIDMTAIYWANVVDSTEELSRHLRNTFSGINSGSNALADLRKEIDQMGCRCGCLERVRALHRTLQEKEDRMLEYVYAMDRTVAEFEGRRR